MRIIKPKNQSNAPNQARPSVLTSFFINSKSKIRNRLALYQDNKPVYYPVPTCTQSSLEYHSIIVAKKEKIKIEVGIREPLLRPSGSRLASTIAVNPFSGQPLLPPFKVGAMTLPEAYAEKIRATITRKEPAIRDFFDVFHAIRMRGLKTQDPDFLSMVKAKIDVPGNEPIDLSEERKQELNRQLEGQLKPVLRPSAFEGFNLNGAFELVQYNKGFIPLTLTPAPFHFHLRLNACLPFVALMAKKGGPMPFP